MNTDIIPPNSDSCEKYILSEIISNQGQFDQTISPNDFYGDRNRKVFKAIQEMLKTGIKIDFGTVREYLAWTDDDGKGYFSELTRIETDSYTLGEYIKIIKIYSVKRNALKKAIKLFNMAKDTNLEIDALTEANEAAYLEISSGIENISEAKDKPELIRPAELTSRMINYNKDDLKISGISTGISPLDPYYKPCKGTLNIISGIPSHGKSSFIDALTVNISQGELWKWCIFSPENFPTEIHLQKLIELFIGKPITEMVEGEIQAAMDFIDRHYRFVKLQEDRHTLIDLMKLITKPCQENQFDAIVIDPWNELDSSFAGERETDFIGRSLSQLRRFGRRNNIAVFILAHPAKMFKNKETGVYDVPTLYDLSGSAHWYNRADNGLTVYRNFDTDTIDIHVQKIKYKIHGKIGLVTVKYNKENGRFEEL